jgi:uncharacterized protein (DUF1501 family)
MSQTDHFPKPLNRRSWLKLSGLSGVAAASATTAGLGTLLGHTPSAHAAGNYRALVCVFLYGGNDGLNTIVPTDAARYNAYKAVRGNLALPKSSLLGLSGIEYGLHPSLSALLPAWRAGRMAPVFNVGPLFAPLDKAGFLSALASGSANLPDSLFSHADQQVLWESATTQAQARTGWGGRTAEVMGTTNPVISVGGNGRFGLSSRGTPLVLPELGNSFGAIELGKENWRLENSPFIERSAALRALYTQAQPSDLGDAYTQTQRDAFAVSERLAALVKAKPGESTDTAAIDKAFAPLISGNQIASRLGKQLYQIAKLVAGNGTVQGNRQLFFAQLGGFDNHGNQISVDALQGEHANLLKQAGDALAAFDAAMVNLGLSDAVTTFTQSDFGRTFKPNNSNGTDHAWGNHHLVMGGAVRGATSYGVYPQLELGGADDAGKDAWEHQGRWIPSTSVDQYAATLLSWFGATDAQLDSILPNLRNFGTKRRLGFV